MENWSLFLYFFAEKIDFQMVKDRIIFVKRINVFIMKKRL